MSSIANLSVQQLRQAADLKEKIAALENELSQLLGSSAKGVFAPVAAKAPKKKLGMSAAGRAAVAAAQKARWAKINSAKPAVKAVSVIAPKKKGGMSAAGKARIIAAQKVRWAKINAAKSSAAVAKPVIATKPAVVAAKPAKKKFTMSAAAKAKISAAAKARWAKVKAAKK